MKIQLNKLKQSFEFMRFHKSQLEIAFQCFEENRKKRGVDIIYAISQEAIRNRPSVLRGNRKKPGSCFQWQ